MIFQEKHGIFDCPVGFGRSLFLCLSRLFSSASGRTLQHAATWPAWKHKLFQPFVEWRFKVESVKNWDATKKYRWKNMREIHENWGCNKITNQIPHHLSRQTEAFWLPVTWAVQVVEGLTSEVRPSADTAAGFGGGIHHCFAQDSP